MKILFIGDLNEYGRSFQRYRTLQRLKCEVVGLTNIPISSGAGSDNHSPFLERVMWHLGWPIDTTSVNRQIRDILKKERFDVVWVEKCLTIRPDTLKFIKRTELAPKLVWLSEDDMFASHNQSFFFRLGLKFYDIVFTTKVYNLTELKELGARRTELFLDSYDETLHRPLALSNEDIKRYGCDVGFIGAFEKDRAEQILYLAEHGIPVTVWGNGWNSWVDKNPNLVVKSRPVYSEEYVKVINATKINLCFLRKINRDEVTSRSVEIPACGGFMLAERTKRHEDFFEEGKEAEFFGSREEMLEKTKYYLGNDEERKKITRAGRERCLKSGYSHRAQLTKMLAQVFPIV